MTIAENVHAQLPLCLLITSVVLELSVYFVVTSVGAFSDVHPTGLEFS